MKSGFKKDTLAYQVANRPALQHRNMGHVPVRQCAEAALRLSTSKNIYELATGHGYSELEIPLGVPEKDAVIFYLLNHAMSIVRKRCHVYAPLGPYLPIVEEYHLQMGLRAHRMFSYLMVICTREARHCQTLPSDYAYKQWAAGFPPQLVEFHQKLRGHKNDHHKAVALFLTSAPDVDLGAYCTFIEGVFQFQFGAQFGGPLWAAIAKVLKDYAIGVETAELMLDHAFSLAHNTGPIFNKGFLYQKYHPTDIYKVLDVQKSGQVPQGVFNKELPHHDCPEVARIMALCLPVMADEFKGYVDWYKVKELGGDKCKNYSSQQQAQVAKHGYPTKIKAMQDLAAAKMELELQEQAAKIAKQVQLHPGCYITKTTRS